MILHVGIGGHGLASVLDYRPGSTILLRANIDDSPIEEQTGLPDISEMRSADTEGMEKTWFTAELLLRPCTT